MNTISAKFSSARHLPDTGVTVLATTISMDKTLQPSDWVVQHLPKINKAGPVLDLACGNGRHTRLLIRTGYPVVAADRDLSRIRDLRNTPGAQFVEADLETETWPLSGTTFAGIIVTDYLYRPNFPHLVNALQPEGVLIYETFAAGNEKFGRPRNPDFLLRPRELLDAFQPSMTIIAYEHVEIQGPRPAIKQRICARLN